jgi:hypothetical protein
VKRIEGVRRIIDRLALITIFLSEIVVAALQFIPRSATSVKRWLLKPLRDELAELMEWRYIGCHRLPTCLVDGA